MGKSKCFSYLNKSLRLFFLSGFIGLGACSLNGQEATYDEMIKRSAENDWRWKGSSGKTATLDPIKLTPYPRGCDSLLWEAFVEKENARMEASKSLYREEVCGAVRNLHNCFRIISDRSVVEHRKRRVRNYAKSLFKDQNGNPKEVARYYGLVLNDVFEIEPVGMDLGSYMDTLIARSNPEVGEPSNFCWAEPLCDSIKFVSKASNVVTKSMDRDTAGRWYTAYEIRAPIREKAAFYRNTLSTEKEICKILVFELRLYEALDTSLTELKDLYFYQEGLYEVELAETKTEKVACVNTIDSFQCFEPLALPVDTGSVAEKEPFPPASPRKISYYSVKKPEKDILMLSAGRDSAWIVRKKESWCFVEEDGVLAYTDAGSKKHVIIKLNEDSVRYLNEDILFIRKKPNCLPVPKLAYLVPGAGFDHFRQRKHKFEGLKSKAPAWPAITGAWATAIGLSIYHKKESNKFYRRQAADTELAVRDENYRKYEESRNNYLLYGAVALGIWVVSDAYLYYRDKRNFRICMENFGDKEKAEEKPLGRLSPGLIELETGELGVGFSYKVKF